MSALTFALSHDPLVGEITLEAGILGLPSQGSDFGFTTPVVVYYSFDETNVTLQDVTPAH